MDSFDFFVQGKYKKIATEQGLDRKYFIFYYIVCNLSAISSFCLMKIIHTYTILYILIAVIGIINGFLLRSKVLSIVKNKQKFLSDMFPLEIPFFSRVYKIPILARFLNRGMKWFYLLSFFCLVMICFSISLILNEEEGWKPYFACYWFGLCYPATTYYIFLSRDYKRIQP
ncbi:hypothetical protein [Kingella denitrificans]|uniref:hypothetical protein n=1 Tax=Kingella denitrificans TaxID=502 RepID=UPI000B982D40|nr:hypothetical protein [Kingella denitrificans]